MIGTQVGGIKWWGKSAPAEPTAVTTTTPTAAQVNIINYLKNKPVEIISNAALKSYLDNVYRFSKEITKPSDKEIIETKKSVIDSDTQGVGASGQGTGQGTVIGVPGAAATAVSASGGTGGGSRRNRKRPTTRKYIKSSYSVKKGKTYKIRI